MVYVVIGRALWLLTGALVGCGAPFSSTEEPLSVGDPLPVIEAGAEEASAASEAASSEEPDAAPVPEASATDAVPGDAGLLDVAPDVALLAIGQSCASIYECAVGDECLDGTCAPYAPVYCESDAGQRADHPFCASGLVCVIDPGADAGGTGVVGTVCILPARPGGPRYSACQTNADCASGHCGSGALNDYDEAGGFIGDLPRCGS